MDDEPASSSAGFGALLRHHRLAAGLSQEALAERARMSSHGISALERGYRRTPQRETLALLAEALQLDDERRRAFELAATRTAGVRRAGAWSAQSSPAGVDAPNLPLALTSFVGREGELTEIAALVRRHRLVTLTGSGGVGKTQTALQVGAALADADGQSVCFVGLGPLGDASFAALAIGSAVGAQASADRSPLQTLLDHLSDKALCLILDNCEHLVDEAARLCSAVLGACPQVRILATSREPLRVAGEFTYRLPSLSLPSAISLFTQRARAVDHHFEIDGKNAPVVAELCGHLDGIPLAIELAAARVNLFSLKAINERLGDRFRLLTGGQRTALPRQQTMRAAIDWSYELLCEPEQRLFERLSVFAGGCTFAGGVAIGVTDEAAEGDVLDALSSLVDKSLVIADLEGSEPRYRLLESFREYARERLVARGDERAIARRHAVACIESAARAGKEWDAWARDELDNWRAALQWALTERGDVTIGQRLAGSLPVGSIPIEARQWVTQAIELVDAQTPVELVAMLAQAKASIAFSLSEHKSTIAACDDVMRLAGEAGNWRGVALAKDMAGHALASLGRVAEATASIQEALAIARKLDDRRLLAWTLRCMGYAAARGHDFAAARGYLTEVLPIYESDFHKVDLAYAINDLGRYEFCDGDVRSALRRAKKMLAIAREAGDDAACVATALDAICVYLIALEQYDEAKAQAREALRLCSEHGLDVLAAHVLQHFAAIAALGTPSGNEERRAACERAARILGFVDARLAAVGSAKYVEQEREYERVLSSLLERLGETDLAEFLAEGAEMTRTQAFDEAAAT
jgi:predicted ATPase/DNA-binding XRE family transcriptional regulator